jgi:glycine betaine/proline transport system ATP-binding protein
MSYIEICNIFKIFGPDPETALELAKNGADKDEILAATGHAVGLHDVSLSIEKSETFVVMGLSGSGKSTLIRHLNRLIDPTAGSISFGGEDILAMDIPTLNAFRRKRLGMVFQRFGLLPHRNVMDNVAYGLEIQGTARKERETAALKWIDRVGLGGYETKFPDQLSGGMQQRVGLARALATDPEVLLMDEAFSALDPLIRSDMQDELMKLQAELHKTIVFITHDLDEALKIGDRIAILKDGKLVQVGRPEEIVLKPANDYVQAFTRDVNRSRVLRAKSIMEPVRTQKRTADSDSFTVDAETRLEELLPRLLTTDDQSVIAVTDQYQCIVGYIQRNHILQVLSS